jgi:BirA family biotin operon repressor/biotin-[acetyl-CoA-carboxylase] ligase
VSCFQTVPNYHLLEYDEVGSTLDVAHELAAKGAEAGTLVVANVQTAGRGRMGRTWRSERGAGIWLTLIERPSDASALEVLSLRVGLALAPALDAFTAAPVRLKWPNDLYLRDRKLAGILIEARWREGHPEWVAIGVGINLRPPASEPRAIGLGADVARDDVLRAIAPCLRRAAARSGALSATEVDAFASRDFAAGRHCVEPMRGTVLGIDASGALLVGVGSAEGRAVTAVRAGSLVLEGAT